MATENEAPITHIGRFTMMSNPFVGDVWLNETGHNYVMFEGGEKEAGSVR
jgi:hypothetical protein